MTPLLSWPGRVSICASLAMAAALALCPIPAAAWSPQTELAIAERAAEIAPPDLERQIDKHRDQFRRGVMATAAPASDLEVEIGRQTQRAIREIEQHLPFAEVVFRLGRLAGLAAAANDPASPGAPAFATDYRQYVDSAWPRFAAVFYGEGRAIRATSDLRLLVRSARDRARLYSPALAEEYRRIAGGRGVDLFDDRSTAFGIASLAFSHAVSDATALFRHIWLEAGGADPRALLLTPPAAPAVSR